jgi:hypothetical protein
MDIIEWNSCEYVNNLEKYIESVNSILGIL